MSEQHANVVDVRLLPNSAPIDRLQRPSIDYFKRHYVDKHRPCIVSGYLDDWKALTAWTPDYLRNAIGHHQVSVSRTAGDRSVFTDDVKKVEKMTFAQFLDVDRSPSAPFKYMMMQRAMERQFPELMDDVVLSQLVEKRRLFQVNFWYLPSPNLTLLHFDVFGNLLAMLKGRKRILLYPPAAHVYPHPVLGTFAQVRVEAPDMERFPRFSHDGAIELQLLPGEMLHIPAIWWHQVYSEPSISVNMWWWPRGSELMRTVSSPPFIGATLKRVRQKISRSLLKKRQPTSVYDEG
jgi:Cupin-like domain